MVLEAILEECHASLLDVVKIKPRVDVKKPNSFPLSIWKSLSISGDYRLIFREGKRYQFVPKPTVQYKKMEEFRDIHCTILSFTLVLILGYDIVFIVETPSSIENQEMYQVTLSDFSACTCLGFVSIKGAALGNGRKKWIICKHLYFVLQSR